MNFQASQVRKFGGVIMGSDIKIPASMYQYITGEGQFYVENPFYDNTMKKTGGNVFSQDDFQSKTEKGGLNGYNPHAPDIFVHHVDGRFYSSFEIGWIANDLPKIENGARYYLMKPYDESAPKPAATTHHFKFTMTSKGTDELENDVNDKIGILHFQLSQVLAYLWLSYIFSVNMGDQVFKTVNDNYTFINTFISCLNGKFTAAGATHEMPKISPEIALKYSEPVIYVEDPDDPLSEHPPTVPAYKIIDQGTAEEFVKLPTILSILKTYFPQNMKAVMAAITGSKEQIARKQEHFKKMMGLSKINPGAAYSHTVKNKGMPDEKVYENFKITADFRIKCGPCSQGQEFFCTKTKALGPGGKYIWKTVEYENNPITSLYNSPVQGVVFFKPEFKIALYRISSAGILPRYTKLSLEKSTRGASDEDDDTLLILNRNAKANEGAIPPTQVENPPVEDDIVIEQGDFSDI